MTADLPATPPPSNALPPAASPVAPSVVTEKSKTTITADTNPPPVGGIKPVHVDGALWVQIGVLTFLLESLSADESKTAFAMHVMALWAIKAVVGSWLAGVSALKMFRSTSYADSKP